MAGFLPLVATVHAEPTPPSPAPIAVSAPAPTPPPPAIQQPPSYSMTPLSGAPGKKYVEFSSINDAGDTVGMCRPEGTGGIPMHWTPEGGVGVSLDDAGGVAYSINKIGVIVGRAGTVPAAWRNGAEKVLAMPKDVSFGSAISINDNGDIVGQAIFKGVSTAFLRLSNKTVFILPPLPGLEESTAYRIANDGEIAGSSHNADGMTQACVWRGRVPVALPALGGAHSEARAMNNHGDIVGDADLASGKRHACLWRGDKPIDLGALPGDDESRALAINDSGEVVGVSGFKTAFVWKDGAMYKLQDAMTPVPTWTPAQATAINNKGQIAGWGADENGRVYGFLLTPK